MKTIAICCLAAILLAGCAAPGDPDTKSGTIKLHGGDVYYESHGKGEPILLLHAGFQNTDMWRHQVPELSKHYQVITIDLPGHGKTQSDTLRMSPPHFISEILDSLGLKKTSIAGVSLGASCVMDFIIAHPERVNKVMLVSTGIVGWEHHFDSDTTVGKFIASFFAHLDKKDTAAAAEGFTRFWFDGPFRSPQEVNDTVRKYIYESTLYNLRRHTFNEWPRFEDTAAIDRLPSIKLPLLVIDGDKDVPHISKTCGYIQKTVPGARRITIKNAGHMLNMESPAEFNKAVLDFLKQ